MPATPVVASVADVVASVASSPAPVASFSAPVVAVPAPLPVASAATAVPSSAASAMVASKASACAYSSDALPQVAPYVAHKEGRYVYVVSTTNAEICVVDGNKQVTVLQMKAGENRSVYGVSPWQISSSGLSKLQVFFQGGRVTVPETATRIQLIEVPVSR